MALENLTPENRVERLLSGADIEPATRLEYFLKQAGSGGGDGLPAYDDEDIGKVLTVVSEYETGAEAIPAQTVTIAQGTATVQNANVSQWTEGQSLQVIYRGTTYTGQITDAEGSLVFGTADFALSYDSSTGVLTVEDNEHSGDNTISAQYVTEHAHADWAEPSSEPSGGIKELIQAEPFYVTDMETSGTKLFSPGVDKCSLWDGGELINLDMFFVDTLEFPYIFSYRPNSYELTSAYTDIFSDNPPDSANYGFGVLPNKTCRVLLGTSGQPIGVAVEKESIAYYLCDFR